MPSFPLGVGRGLTAWHKPIEGGTLTLNFTLPRGPPGLPVNKALGSRSFSTSCSDGGRAVVEALGGQGAVWGR